MSLFDKQSLSVLATCHGAVISIRDNYTVGPEFEEQIKAASDLLRHASKNWPTDGPVDPEWIVARLSRWSRAQAEVNGEWSIMGLLDMSMTSLTRLSERADEKARKSRLAIHQAQADLLTKEIFDALQGLIDYLRADGVPHAVSDVSNLLLGKLDEILEVAA